MRWPSCDRPTPLRMYDRLRLACRLANFHAEDGRRCVRIVRMISFGRRASNVNHREHPERLLLAVASSRSSEEALLKVGFLTEYSRRLYPRNAHKQL